jgi:2'-5' RNA ligase
LPQNIAPQALRLSSEFASLHDNYLLGQASYPHVTICQFYAEENQVQGLWEKAVGFFNEKSLYLSFKQATTFVINERLWVQLIPEPHARLQQLHNALAELIKEPLGLAREKYSPHLTLANIKKELQEKACAQVAALRVSLADEFVLALGHCDANGQFTEVFYCANSEYVVPGQSHC